MKERLSKSFLFASFLFVVLGCSMVDKIKKEVEKTQSPQVLTSTDGKYQLTVPGNWKTETELHDQAELQAANRIGELYVIVIRESKEDFSDNTDVAFVTENARSNLREAAANLVMSEPAAVNINGNRALQFEASGEVDNIKAKYLYAIVETPQNFYQIMTWTLTSRFDRNKDVLQGVINSFKEISGGDLAPPPPSVNAASNKK